MKISVQIEELPKSKDEEHHYKMKLETYKSSIEGKFEKSELRNLIEKIDNVIY